MLLKDLINHFLSTNRKYNWYLRSVTSLAMKKIMSNPYFFVLLCLYSSEPQTRQSSSAGNVRTQTPIREKGQSLSCGSQIRLLGSRELIHTGYMEKISWLIHNLSLRGCFVFSNILQQRQSPARRSCWGNCRKRGPVRCAWTSWCPSSSSPVVTWSCAQTARPACATALSAGPSLEAAFGLSCPSGRPQPYSCWTCSLKFLCIHFSLGLIKKKNKDYPQLIFLRMSLCVMNI